MDNQAINLMVTECLPPAIKAQTEYTTARVQHYVNRGYFDFVRRTKCIEEEIDITTVDAQPYYDVTDKADLAYVYHINEVRYIIAGSTDVGYKLKPFPGGHRLVPRVISTGTPTHYWVQFVNVDNDVRIGTWPVINGTGNTLRLFTYMFPKTLLSANADEPVIKIAYRDALSFYAVSKIYSMFSHINPQWQVQADRYMGLYMDQVEDYKYHMTFDSADEFPQLFASAYDTGDEFE